MKHGLHTAKRILSLILAVMMMASFFSACGSIPRNTPYTFRVENDASGERQWNVKRTAYDDTVAYTVQDAGDGMTDIVFTGQKKGTTDVTVYLARAGEDERYAADVYVLTLKVDARKNVTQPEPVYGAYSVRLSGDVTGAEWYVDCSDTRIVRWKADREYPKKSTNEDGMQDFTQIYTFTGRRPGAAHVRICTRYPWAEDAESTRKDLWLLVDDAYCVSLLEAEDFTSIRVSEQGTSAIHDVFEAQRTEDGVRLSQFQATYYWSDEQSDYVETRQDETVIDGGEALYLYLAGLLHMCGARSWDGFRGSNSRVLDGTMFSFEAVLADGTKVTASGSNVFPKHFKEFWRSLYGAVRTYDAAEDAQ